jgi:CubicO group peptidase (beta-lactamase class C family)
MSILRRFLAALSVAAAIAVLLPVTTVAADSVASHPRVQQALKLLDIWLDAQRDYDEIPGLSVAVVHDQEVIWKKAYGFADVASKTAARTDTIYSICSISKLFTSIAVMQQRDAGKLRLDDPVATHLPWFAIKKSDPTAPEITVEGLLTHSSGLPREADYPYWTAPEFTFPTREQMIDALKKQETYFGAQSYFQYSNLGLSLAGEVAAAAAGQPYADYVRARILQPLAMNDTTSEMPKTPRLATAYSSIQRDGARQPVGRFTAQGIAPAAGYASTVEDLAKFASWQFRLLEGKGGENVLGRNTLREMQRVHWMDPDFSTPQGLGFAVWRDKEKTFVGHGGSCPGFRSHLLMNTPEEIAVVIMANAQGVNTGAMSQRAYEIVNGAIKTAAKATSAAKPADSSLDKYAGNYTTGFAGEAAFVVWEDGLASVGLPSTDPMAGLTRWKKTGEHTFRRVRKDETLAESLRFEMDADGKAARIIWHSNTYRRLK